MENEVLPKPPESEVVSSAPESKATETKPSAADLAARDFPSLLNAFKKTLQDSECAGQKLKDVFVALMEYPLENNSFRFRYPAQQELYLIGTKLFDSKFILVKEIFDLKKEDLDKLVQELKEKENAGV